MKNLTFQNPFAILYVRVQLATLSFVCQIHRAFIVSPTSELQRTLLLVERKVVYFHCTRCLEHSRRQVVYRAVVRHDCVHFGCRVERVVRRIVQ